MATAFENPPLTASLEAFPDDLVDELAQLGREENDVAEIALQVMPFGYRAVLKASGYISQASTGVWHFTDDGLELLEVCTERQTGSVKPSLEALDRAVESLLKVKG